jgi:hypothetical protein
MSTYQVTMTNPAAQTGVVSGFPASYYTGPLGANNVLPNTGGFLFGMWSAADGNSAAQNRTLVQQRLTDSGRSIFDLIGYKLDAANLATGDTYGTTSETWIHGLGSIPCVTYHPCDTAGVAFTPADMAAGLHDSTLATVATRFINFGHRIIWRFWREQNSQNLQPYFTGDSSNTAPQLATIASDWIAGWRYIVNYMRTAGATNVGFCWCPSELANRNNTVGFTGRTQLLATYPGDAYVDWVGIDRYNHGINGGNSSPMHTGWAEFDELFNYTTLGYNSGQPSIMNEYGGAKPIVIWETGGLYDSGSASRKANWYTNIGSVSYPHTPTGSAGRHVLCGVQQFDQWISSNNADWEVDRNQVNIGDARGGVDATTYAGWESFAATAVTNVGAVGGAT